MNRDMFNEKKKLSNMDTPDASWAEDVSFKSLEKKIKDSKKASEKAFLKFYTSKTGDNSTQIYLGDMANPAHFNPTYLTLGTVTPYKEQPLQ